MRLQLIFNENLLVLSDLDHLMGIIKNNALFPFDDNYSCELKNNDAQSAIQSIMESVIRPAVQRIIKEDISFGDFSNHLLQVDTSDGFFKTIFSFDYRGIPNRVFFSISIIESFI